MPLLKKLENRFPKFHAGIQFAKEKFEKYSTLSVGLGRVIPLCRTYISFVAGLAEQNILVFTAASAAGIAYGMPSLWDLDTSCHPTGR